MNRRKINRLLLTLLWTALVGGVLAAAFWSNAKDQALRCRVMAVAIDANGDGRFTISDLGAAALQVAVLPLKILSQRPEFEGFIQFFELKPFECATPKALLLSGGLLVPTVLGLALAASLAWLAVRRLAHAAPRFAWLIPPRHLVLLSAGLTAVLLHHIRYDPEGSESRIQAKAPPSRDRAADQAIQGKASATFIRELSEAVNNVRQRGCDGRAGVSPVVVHPTLSNAAALIQQGRELRAAQVEAGYRGQNAQSIQLGGHRSIASIQRVLVDQYCPLLLDAGAMELGIAGSMGSLTIVLARPRGQETVYPRATVDQVVELVNAARAAGGSCATTVFPPAPPLSVNEKLQASAQAHADDMAEREYFSHRSADGRTTADRIQAAGYYSLVTGENLAAGQRTAAKALEGWLKSPSHCRNIYAADLSEIGVGVAIRPGSKHGIYWVQNFGAGER